MKIFLSTSLKNQAEASRLHSTLETHGHSVFCCFSDTKKLTNRELFRHNRDQLFGCDLFVAVLKNVGRDVAAEIGMACALDKPRIGILYDLQPSDIMTYFSFERLIKENELSAALEEFAPSMNAKLCFAHNSLRKHTSTILNRLKTVFDSYKLVEGEFVRLLEQELASRYGRSVVAVSSGTMGLVTTLQVLLQERRKVIVPGLSFSAAVQAVRQAGGEPIFCDVDPHTWLLDPDAVRRSLDADTGAVLAVDLFGVPCVDQKLTELVAEFDIPIVYDSCQAFGGRTRDSEIGSYGAAVVFSLDATKLVSAGLGGFVSVESSLLADDIRCAKCYGSKASKVLGAGTNGKMAETAAIIALSSLEAVDQRIEQVMLNRAMYREVLGGQKGIRLQDEQDSISASPLFPVLVTYEDSYHTELICESLAEQNIEVRIYNPNCLHRVLSSGSETVSLHVTESMEARIVCLPAHPQVESAHIETIGKVFRDLMT